MSTTDTIKELTKHHYLGFGYGVISLITPGVLFIYHFKYDVFLTLDISKIFILSISITTPVVFFNYVATVIFAAFTDTIDKELLWNSFINSSIVSSSALFVTLYYFYLVDNYFIKDFVIYLSITNIVLLITSLIAIYLSHAKPSV